MGRQGKESFTLSTNRLTEPSPQDDEMHVVAMVKDEERYVFVFDAASRADALRKLGDFAGNDELSFSWYNAAVLSQKI